jgi:nicotinate-nucleotide adenylyltransferase
VAQDALVALGLDRILFVPAAAPPHKRGWPITPAALRLEMLRAAVAGDPRFEVSDLELRRAGPSFTVDTLRELHAEDRAGELFFLLGADQFREFDTWRESREIARLARLVVLTRDGAALEPRPEVPHQLLEVTRIGISATALRTRVAAGEPIRYLVPDSVAEVIEREGLYR